MTIDKDRQIMDSLANRIRELEAALKVERERRETTKAVLEICQKNKASMEAALQALEERLRKYENP